MLSALAAYRRLLHQLPLDRPLNPKEAIDLLEARAQLDQAPEIQTPDGQRQLQQLDCQLQGWSDRLLAALESAPPDRPVVLGSNFIDLLMIF